MRRTFKCAPSRKASRKAVNAASSANVMLNAFEDKLAELSVRSKTDITCSYDDDSDYDRSVEVLPGDSYKKFEDVGGGFGEPGSIYTLAEIKEFWNNENMNDPILVDYSSYDSWWRDTRDNFLEEV